MDKVLVTLTVPVISEKYDIWIPTFLEIREVKRLLAKAVVELSGGRYVSSGNEILIEKETNHQLAESDVIQQYDIKNGNNLIMM